MIISLKNIELFKDLTCLETGSHIIDLHNDYKCDNLVYNSNDKDIKLTFEPTSKELESIGVGFKNAFFETAYFSFASKSDKATINSFYRGRYEIDGKLFDSLETGESCYYIEFEEGDSFVILAKEVTVYIL